MLAFLIGLCYSMVNLAHRFINEARNVTGPDYDGTVETAPWLATLRATGFVAVIGGPMVPFYIYLGLDFTMKLRLLPTQLHTFDARKASCYCCTVPGTLFGLKFHTLMLLYSYMQETQVDHTDPRSNAPIFCDRQLILEKLTEWYGDPEDTDMGIDRAIEQFNHLVRKELADVFLEMMSGRDVLWQYIYLLIGMNLVCQNRANVSVPKVDGAEPHTQDNPSESCLFSEFSHTECEKTVLASRR